MAVTVPVGMLFAAHRLSEPEGLDAAEQPTSALEFVTAADSSVPARPSAVRPPARSFTTGAFGHSNAVRIRVALPNEPIRMPLDFDASTDGLQAQWIGFDGAGNGAVAPWPSDGVLRAPARPGAFWLVVSRGGVTDTVADLAVFVERPMPNQMATGINGYHMGRWPKASDGIVPRGFIEVTQRLSEFPLSPHLRLSDFVVHDAQDYFPKYLHVREPLLDKIELVVDEIAQMRGRAPALVKLNVASGFRSPAHNGALSGTAQDSRHMYGDAADIAIDANNDGKLTEIDARLVAAAAEVVERKYPDLVGGVGLYVTTEGAGWPYVHVDVRGRRARWRGGVRNGGEVTVDSLPPNATFDTAATVAKEASPAESRGAEPHAVGARSAAPASSSPAVPARVAAVAPTVSTPRAPEPLRRVASGAAARPRAPARTATARKPAASARPKQPVPVRRRPKKPAPGLTRQRAAAHSGARPGSVPAKATTVRPSEDPFASAARKFHKSRP